MNETMALYREFCDEVGDPVVASNLTVAHVMLRSQELRHELTLTVPEAAKRLKLSEKTTRKLCQNGDLPFSWVGNQIRILPSAVESLLRKSHNG